MAETDLRVPAGPALASALKARSDAAARANLPDPDYGPVFGLLTPQANTTVEPEMRLLLRGALLTVRCTSASGVAGGAWFGISAPARLPGDIAQDLQTEVQMIVNAPDMQAQLAELGMAPLALAGADFVAFIATESRRWGPVIKAANLRVA